MATNTGPALGRKGRWAAGPPGRGKAPGGNRFNNNVSVVVEKVWDQMLAIRVSDHNSSRFWLGTRVSFFTRRLTSDAGKSFVHIV